jgi:uncharacterized protein Smg (DUF494 family)
MVIDILHTKLKEQTSSTLRFYHLIRTTVLPVHTRGGYWLLSNDHMVILKEKEQNIIVARRMKIPTDTINSSVKSNLY